MPTPQVDPTLYEGAVTFPNGSVYLPKTDMFVLPNGRMIGNGPNAKQLIEQQLALPPVQSNGGQPDPNLWKGAVTFPNGSVYFPSTDMFVLPNGRMVGNGPNAKQIIEEELQKPTVRGPQGGVYNPKGSQAKGGQPMPDNNPTPPTVPGGGGTDPTGVQGLGTGGNFSKGQPRPDQDFGGQFMPFLEQFYGQQGGFNPYAGGMNGGGGPGYGGGGWGSNGGMPNAGDPRYYDPLGIGASGGNFYQNYMDDNADYYPMVGVNSVTGYDGQQPMYGVVGGQGGYGVGMVGPEYSGPLWNNYPDLNLLQQRQMLTNPTTAMRSPYATQATTASTNTNTTNTSNNGSSNVNPSKGQPAQQQQTATGQQGGQQGQTPWSYYESGNYYGTPYGQLVQSNSGNGYLAKSINGGDQQYAFNPQSGQWQMATPGQLGGTEQVANPMQYGDRSGAAKTEYQQKNGFWQAKPGTGTYR